MKKLVLPTLLFIIFLIEGIFTDIIPSQGTDEIHRIFVPHFLLISLLLIMLYYDLAQALIFGAVFGLLMDIMFTGLIGVYLFTLPLSVYIIWLCMKPLHKNLLIIVFMSIFGTLIVELLVFFIQLIIGTTELDWGSYIINRLFPTLVLNGVFVIIVYYPFRYVIGKINKLRTQNSA